MKEEAVRFGHKQQLVGTLTLPVKLMPALPAVILLNAGLTHRIGPNRIYVKLARQLGRLNFMSLRFDQGGLGDSPDTSAFKNGDLKNIREIKSAMEFLGASKGIQQFILIGLCSGGDLAFQTALQVERIAGIVTINGSTLDNDLITKIWPLAERKISKRYKKKKRYTLNRWKSVLLKPQKLAGWLKRKYLDLLNKKKCSTKAAGLTETEQANTLNNIRALCNRKIKLKMIFSEGSAALDLVKLTYYDKLASDFPEIDFEIMQDIDHVFTPVWSQNQLSEKVLSWLGTNFQIAERAGHK